MSSLATYALLLSINLAGLGEARFEEARNLFLYQDCKGASPILQALLYPRQSLDDPAKEALAREYLGACFWWGDNPAMSDVEFTALLVKFPSRRLDPFYYPPEMIRHFDQIRERLLSQGIITETGDGTGPSTTPGGAEDPANALAPTIVRVHHRDRLPMFLPFGIPQFANEQPVKGVLFATGQALALATNVGSYLAIELMREPSGLFSDTNYGRARSLQTVLYSSFAAWGALYAWSLIDGLLSFEPEWTESPDGEDSGTAKTGSRGARSSRGATAAPSFGLGVGPTGSPIATFNVSF